jgi:translation initiation factor eIF-2B subunit epsilon
VKIEAAYIFDNVSIGDGSIVKHSIVSSEAVLGKKSRVEEGALLSWSVRISDGTTVMGTKITRKRKEADGDEVTKGVTDPSIVGSTGEGFEFKIDEDQDDEVEALADTGFSESAFF